MADQRKCENDSVPALRFEGFSDPWEQRAFCALVERRNSFSDDKGLPRVEYEDIVSGQGTLNNDVFSKNDKRGGIAFEPNDVLYGKLRPYLRNWLNPQFRGIALGDFWVLNPISVNSSFLFTLIRTSAFERVANESTGTKMPRADWQNVSSAEFAAPVSGEEQQRIGALFAKLDSLITLHQRKVDKLKTVKQSLLEKMFPREGENVPEIRFEGFTDPWEQRKVHEVLSIVVRSVDLKDDEEYQLITVKRRNEGIVQRTRAVGKDILVKNYQEILAGDFVISKRQLVHGGNGLVPEHLARSIVSNEYLVIVGNKDISTNFWALISRTAGMYRQYFLSSFGVDIEKLVFDVDDWRKRLIVLPQIEEQRQMESLFAKLDSLITLHQRELEILKNLKQACLEKMFV